MSGGNVDYTLRPNKFVERKLFIELLGKIIGREYIDKYSYISLGGPQLEDLKLIHYELGIKDITSLEADSLIFERQQFNMRASIVCKNETSGEFIDNLDISNSNKHVVVWLDYAAAGQRFDQLVEFEKLISKLRAGDIVKITMNANMATLGLLPGKTREDNNKYRLQNLRSVLGKYSVSPPTPPEELTQKIFVVLLCRAIKRAALEGIRGKPDTEIIPLSIFLYQDGEHQMLTITVMLTETVKAKVIPVDLQAMDWEFLPSDWEDITKINIPNLTTKERLFIEGLLAYENKDTLYTKLPFRLHKKDDKFQEMLDEFVKHYRRYPNYLQVIL
jgi:hypothetical protein